VLCYSTKTCEWHSNVICTGFFARRKNPCIVVDSVVTRLFLVSKKSHAKTQKFVIAVDSVVTRLFSVFEKTRAHISKKTIV
jgi:hypothetical protein